MEIVETSSWPPTGLLSCTTSHCRIGNTRTSWLVTKTKSLLSSVTTKTTTTSSDTTTISQTQRTARHDHQDAASATVTHHYNYVYGQQPASLAIMFSALCIAWVSCLHHHSECAISILLWIQCKLLRETTTTLHLCDEVLCQNPRLRLLRQQLLLYHRACFKYHFAKTHDDDDDDENNSNIPPAGCNHQAVRFEFSQGNQGNPGALGHALKCGSQPSHQLYGKQPMRPYTTLFHS